MGAITVNEVRRGFYLDSVALMRVAQTLRALPGVEEAALMMGTPANRDLMQEAGVLDVEGAAAAPNDLVVAVRAADRHSAKAALAQASRQLDRPPTAASASDWRPRTLRQAAKTASDANLALISVPADYAVVEARKAIREGLHAMVFSDNVPLDAEQALKEEARDRGLLVMGPDCGTAILGGVPLAFANAVPHGDIGIVGASGTGMQEVSCLIARHGGGVSHAIGVGGRDLSAAVGGISTLMAMDLFDADDGTRHVVLISKPPDGAVAQQVVGRIARSPKPYTVCFLGADAIELPTNASRPDTLADAAARALGLERLPERQPGLAPLANGRDRVAGLFSGGTLCAEAQLVFRAGGRRIASNAPIPGVASLETAESEHVFVDLGADEYTRGRPHPMIEPAVRDDALLAALQDPTVGMVLLDFVLGTGAHTDPAGHVACLLADRAADYSVIVASVTGTDADPQNRAAQVRVLEDAGVVVAGSNAAAACYARACVAAARD